MTSPGRARSSCVTVTPSRGAEADDLEPHLHVAGSSGRQDPRQAYGMTSGGMCTSSVASLHGPQQLFGLGVNTGADVLAAYSSG